MENTNNEIKSAENNEQNKPKVTGIGGIFFLTEDPNQTKAWYTKNLGIEINAWGSSSFESRNKDNPEQMESLQWKPFKTGDEFFSPSTTSFQINYRVQHLEALVEQLKQNGVTILDTIATYDYGKFIHILDPEGNKIQLWEPAE